MIGFTQSSYPAYELPSDEDYKTLPFVIAPQRWVKDLEYASLTLLFSSDEEAIEVSHVNLGVMKGPRTEISADEGGDIRQQGRRYLPVRTEISASKDARLTDRIKCRLAFILYYEENESVSEIICVSLAIAKAEDKTYWINGKVSYDK